MLLCKKLFSALAKIFISSILTTSQGIMPSGKQFIVLLIDVSDAKTKFMYLKDLRHCYQEPLSIYSLVDNRINFVRLG